VTETGAKNRPKKVTIQARARAYFRVMAETTMTKIETTHGASVPEFIRLPKAGERCPFTGLSRSYLNSLILGPNPPVKSFVLRKRGARTGVRLISYDSLLAYIRKHETTSTTEK